MWSIMWLLAAGTAGPGKPSQQYSFWFVVEGGFGRSL